MLFRSLHRIAPAHHQASAPRSAQTPARSPSLCPCTSTPTTTAASLCSQNTTTATATSLPLLLRFEAQVPPGQHHTTVHRQSLCLVPRSNQSTPKHQQFQSPESTICSSCRLPPTHRRRAHFQSPSTASNPRQHRRYKLRQATPCSASIPSCSFTQSTKRPRLLSDSTQCLCPVRAQEQEFDLRHLILNNN